jgi:hypothetical protein
MKRRGRPSSSRRLQVEECASIDMKGHPPIELSYTNEEMMQKIFDSSLDVGSREASFTVTWPNGYVEQVIAPVTVTHPHLGGIRQWFLCLGCERRVRKIYSPGAGYPFMCRLCYRLVYKSQYWGNNPNFKLFRRLGLI